MFQMLEVVKELICGFDQSRFDPEIKALLLGADVSESFLKTSFEHLCSGSGLMV